ncbi:MAG: hypothetical protein MJA29_10130, partial [Candidatus Omnitrophica bacterium]|nr:hypothetical protein [Candidatus Omnitrophota bacterium]
SDCLQNWLIHSSKCFARVGKVTLLLFLKCIVTDNSSILGQKLQYQNSCNFVILTPAVLKLSPFSTDCTNPELVS